MISKVMARYRAIGWRGSGEDTIQRVRNEAWSTQMRKQREVKLGVKNNKLLQKHFRPQVVF